MTSEAPKISFIIPVFRETERLPAFISDVKSFFARFPMPVEAVFVVDPPFDRDAVLAFDKGFGEETSITRRWLFNDTRLGRGPSVAEGLLQARGDFLLSVTADLAVPLGDLLRMYQASLDQPEARTLFVANRYSPKKMRGGPRPTTRTIFENIERDKLKAFGLLDPASPVLGFQRALRSEILPSKVRPWFYGSSLISEAGRKGIKIEEVPVNSRDTADTRFRWWQGIR